MQSTWITRSHWRSSLVEVKKRGYKRNVVLFRCSVVSDSFVTPWTVACQAPLSMGFPRQEHCTGLPFPSPGDLPDPGIEPRSPAWVGRFFITEPPGKPCINTTRRDKCYNWGGHSYHRAWSRHDSFFLEEGSVQFSSVQFSHSVVFDSLRPHESQHTWPPCPLPTPGA